MVYVALWARGYFFDPDGTARRRIGARGGAAAALTFDLPAEASPQDHQQSDRGRRTQAQTTPEVGLDDGRL